MPPERLLGIGVDLDQRAPLPLLQQRLGLVDRDRDEPRPEASRVADGAELPPGDRPRGLDPIGRDGLVTTHRHADAIHLVVVRLDDAGEGQSHHRRPLTRGRPRRPAERPRSSPAYPLDPRRVVKCLRWPKEGPAGSWSMSPAHDRPAPAAPLEVEDVNAAAAWRTMPPADRDVNDEVRCAPRQGDGTPRRWATARADDGPLPGDDGRP